MISAGAEAPAIDLEILADLRRTFEPGSESLVALVDLFVDGAREHLAKARAATEAHDAEGVLNEAHALKGNCGFLGALVLADRVRALESVSSEPEDWAGVLAAIGDAERELQRVESALERHVPEWNA